MRFIKEMVIPLIHGMGRDANNMKYRIMIDKIEEKKVLKNIWITDDELIARKDKGNTNYRTIDKTEDVSEQIYEQTIDKQIDLKAIIDAFNK